MADTHVDHEALSALREVMEDSYPELLDTFLADSENRLRELQQTADADALSSVAHSFKGSSSNMGAVGLAALCQQLEERVKQSPAYGVEDLVNRIDSEYRQVKCFYLLECERVSGS